MLHHLIWRRTCILFRTANNIVYFPDWSGLWWTLREWRGLWCIGILPSISQPPPVERNSPMCPQLLLLLLPLPPISFACQPKAFVCSSLNSRSLACSCAHHSPPPIIHNLNQVFQAHSPFLKSAKLTNCSEHTSNLKLHLGKPFTNLDHISISSFLSLSLLLTGNLVLPNHVAVDVKEVSSLLLQGTTSCSAGSQLFLSIQDVRRLILRKLHLPSCNLHLNLTTVKDLDVGVIRIPNGGLQVEGQPSRCSQGGQPVPCEHLLMARMGKGEGWPMVHLTLLLIISLTIVTIVVICTTGKRPGEQVPAFRRGWIWRSEKKSFSFIILWTFDVKFHPEMKPFREKTLMPRKVTHWVSISKDFLVRMGWRRHINQIGTLGPSSRQKNCLHL